MATRKVGKYEVGRTIGEGTFAKVKFAQNTETGQSVAMKVLSKNTVLKHKMVDQVMMLSFSSYFGLLTFLDLWTFDLCTCFNFVYVRETCWGLKKVWVCQCEH